MRANFKEFLKDGRGQALLSHVLLISGISLVLVPTLQAVGARLTEVFDRLTAVLR